ncbi:unnamed protein product [Durusdinium trenchii]|uniref:Cilia- and flagella-associated protein 57 n=2 Tax=Durusdinium trenchii TaxID=1381693 RepID=A0ABP0HZF5_9DINO
MATRGATETDVKLRLAHAFGVYPSPIKDAVISLGEDTFAFCVGRHVALCHQHRQRLSFLGRDARHRIITAMTKSHNGKFLAIGERVGSEDGSNQHAAQISVVGVSKADLLGETKDFKDETLKVLHPSNKRLDIIGLAFTGDGKHLISVSSMPDATVSFWRWDVEKLMSSHDMQTPVNRVLVNPSNVTQFSVGGHAYLRLWDFNPNDQGLTENPSLFPLKQEKQMKVVDHCWALSIFLCAASEDGHIHIFQDGELVQDVDVRAQIKSDESTGPKAVEKEQARQLANLMGEAGPGTADAPPVRITTITAWFQGFVVGGDQGYLGVFRIDAKAQVDSVGTFRMPGEKAMMWNMSTSTEESSLVILSYEEHETESMASSGTRSRGNSASRQSTRSRASSANTGGRMRPMGAKWSLHTFPMAQADLVGTGQLEVFTPVFRFGAHHGSVTSLKPAFSRRMVASCAEDRSLKLWSFPTEEQEAQAMSLPFSAELSLQVSSYECASALAVHPLGFQIAAILEDIVRIYHLTPIQATRTQFDLPLKNPGGVAYSNGGSLLAVSSENDVALIDPWRAVVIHLFSGRGGGHVSPVNRVLFSEDDRWLLSSGTAPHGAIYGWDLSTPARERCFEHVCKHSTYTDFSFDARQGLVVACREPEGHLRVIGHLSSPQYEIQPENKQSAFTCQCLAAALGLLLAGTRQGSVRIYRWPFQVGSAALTEISLHAHSITAMTLTLDARYLFTGCEGGAVLCCEVAQSTLDSEGDLLPISATEIEQQIVRFRHGENEKPVSSKAQREDDRKALELQEKLWEAVKAISASTAKLDDLQMIPKTYLSDVLSEIRALEDRMDVLKHDSDRVLEQKEQELQDKLISIQMEQRSQKSLADEKYDNLFMQLKQSTERHEKEMQEANTHFDHRHKKMQDELEGTISKEYEKNSKLLDELQSLRDEFEGEKTKMLKSHDEQLLELRSAQERALRDWRTEYDKVCSLLKSDGLKFEEALRQQESEYESQIVEIKERERRALQDESEKAATALKDGVSMKQTISMLQNQVKSKDVEIAEAAERQEDLKKKLQASQEMVEKVRAQLKERERSLKVKDESLNKLRGQMKHLESFRFVLFHKVRALEEERDPLEEQVNSLKTSVREMYTEFVREFRQKQKLHQTLSDKSMLSSSLQQENVELRAQLVQLKKDSRRMIQQVETVLHPDTTHDYTQMPKKLQSVLEKYQKLLDWKPADEPVEESRSEEEANGKALIEEMAIQRDLLFRRKEIATAAAEQTKRECTQDVRKLTSENAQLIVEMNTLRAENRSYQRSCREMEANIMALRAKAGSRGGPMNTSSSAPNLVREAKQSRVLPNGRPLASSETPYVRRKVVDQQEKYRRQQVRGVHQLPPIVQRSSSPVSYRGTNAQETRFERAMASFHAEMRYLQEQGLDVSKLHQSAAEIAAVQAEQVQMTQMAEEQIAQARMAYAAQMEQAQMEQAQMAQAQMAQGQMEAQVPQEQNVEAHDGQTGS